MTDTQQLEDWLIDWEDAQEAGLPVSAASLCGDRTDLIGELQRRIDRLQQVGRFDMKGGVAELKAGNEPIPGYRLVKILGRGGNGEVWQATGPGEFQVALKFVPLGGKAGRDELRAIQGLRSIRHPHLLTLLGSWESNGWLVVGSEVACASLYDRFQETTASGRRGLSPGLALGYFYAAATALDHLHQCGVLHRDVKPQNLLLQGGVLKVADFGLARATDHTLTGHTGGMTLPYAAPEFFDGKSHRHSDQYALAVSYCQIRGGRLPFTGTAAQVMRGHLTLPPDLTMLPGAERHTVAKALSKEPTERWPNCTEFMEALFQSRGRPLPTVTQPSTSLNTLSLEDMRKRASQSFRSEQYTDAEGVLDLALRLVPGLDLVHAQRSINRMRLGDLAGARDDWNKAGGGGAFIFVSVYISMMRILASDSEIATAEFESTATSLRVLREKLLLVRANRNWPATVGDGFDAILVESEKGADDLTITLDSCLEGFVAAYEAMKKIRP